MNSKMTIYIYKQLNLKRKLNKQELNTNSEETYSERPQTQLLLWTVFGVQGRTHIELNIVTMCQM